MGLWVYFVESPRQRTVTADSAEQAARLAAQAEGDKRPDVTGSFKLPVWVCPADTQVVPARDVQKFDAIYSRRPVSDVDVNPVPDAPDDPPPA